MVTASTGQILAQNPQAMQAAGCTRMGNPRAAEPSLTYSNARQLTGQIWIHKPQETQVLWLMWGFGQFAFLTRPASSAAGVRTAPKGHTLPQAPQSMQRWGSMT